MAESIVPGPQQRQATPSGRAYRWARGTRIEVLDDLAPEALVGNVPLGERQERVLRRGGMRMVEVDDPGTIEDRCFVLFADNLYITWPLLKKFLKAARRQTSPGCYQLALPESALTRLTTFTGEQPIVELADGRRAYRHALYWVSLNPSDSVTSALEDPTPLVIEPWMKSVTVPFSSRIPTMTDVTLPVTDQVAIEVTSWVHLLMANCYAIGEWAFGLWRSPLSLVWLSWKVLAGVLGAFSIRPGQIALSVARRVVVRGRGCVIHPSAVVEGSVLGRNVFVGPHCVIRGSILGDGVHVMEYSVIDGCVIGDRAIINQRGYLKLSLLYPEAVLNWLVTGVVGRRTFLGELFMALDMKVVGEIEVRHRGRLASTGLSFLGCCFGHRVYISGESRMRPGRVIPNDYKIVSDLTGYFDVVPADLPTDHILYERAGVLEPLMPIAPRGSLAEDGDEPDD